ncbi:MAG: hypothetical protein PW788_06910 [Micavibrio sp.]|nr:hypothetical protein [Micavibrio sp.]
MFRGLVKAYENFQQTLTEGHYMAAPLSIWSLFKPRAAQLPHSPQITLGTGMLGTTRSVGNRWLWASLVALLSMKTLVAWGAGFGTVGVGFLALEYVRSARARHDVIREINFAGQTVEGTRSDLCRLHNAQMNVMNLASSFREASMETTHDTIRRLMDSVSEERARVRVVDAGAYGARDSVYDFSKPNIRLVDEWNDVAGKKIAPGSSTPASLAIVEPPAPPPVTLKIAEGSLRQAWEMKADSDADIVARIVALEQSLPPHIMEQVRAHRAEMAPRNHAPRRVMQTAA